MRGTLALVLGLAAFTAACGGDDDDGNGNGSGSDTGTTPSVSGVFPIAGFTGRTIRIEVSGDATTFAAGATIDLGAGTKVKNVTVGSPTTLFADVDVDPDAALGLRDVAVKNGSDSFTLSKAFELKSPVELLTSGDNTQGGQTFIEIINKDLENSFDTTCGVQGTFGCLLYVGVEVDVDGGVANVTSVDENHIFATVFADTDATKQSITLLSGATNTLTSIPEDASINVTARTATAVPTAEADLALDDDGTALFTVAVAANTLSDTTVVTGDQYNGSTIYILPSSGHWADGIDSAGPDAEGTLRADAFSTTATTKYLVYVDDGYMDPATVLSKTITPGTAVADTEANNTTATAQTLTLPAYVSGGTLADVNDQDWFKFTVAAANNGKTLRVFTFGDPQTDTLVDAQNGTAANGSIGVSDDSGYQENFVSTKPLATGTSYVEISASQSGYFQGGHNTYGAIIWAE